MKIKRVQCCEAYEQLAKMLAHSLPKNILKNLCIEYLKQFLGKEYENWDYQDWYRFMVDIRKYYFSKEYALFTAEYLFAAIPYASQRSTQAVVKALLKKASEGKLRMLDETVEVLKDVLFNLFYCTRNDIVEAIVKFAESKPRYSLTELDANALLLGYISVLRDVLWESSGNVLTFRENICDNGGKMRYVPSVKTNADHIHAMNVDELALFIEEQRKATCPNGACAGSDYCYYHVDDGGSCFFCLSGNG